MQYIFSILHSRHVCIECRTAQSVKRVDDRVVKHSSLSQIISHMSSLNHLSVAAPYVTPDCWQPTATARNARSKRCAPVTYTQAQLTKTPSSAGFLHLSQSALQAVTTCSSRIRGSNSMGTVEHSRAAHRSAVSFWFAECSL